MFVVSLLDTDNKLVLWNTALLWKYKTLNQDDDN